MSASARPDFGRLARWYQALEFVAFGRDLERARFYFLPALASCRSVLILGEGDGRFLAKLRAIAPSARIDCVEGSRGMIEAATARLTPDQRESVSFTCADLRSWNPPNCEYDAVVTLFVLDCFSTAEVEQIVTRIAPRIAPGGNWLFADFVLPSGGWRRLRARLWLAMLYRFFGISTRLTVRALPDAKGALQRAGFIITGSTDLQGGMLQTVRFTSPPPPR